MPEYVRHANARPRARMPSLQGICAPVANAQTGASSHRVLDVPTAQAKGILLGQGHPPLDATPPARHRSGSGNFFAKKAGVRMQDISSLSSTVCAKAELQVSKPKMRLSTAWRRGWGLASGCLNVIGYCADANRRRKLALSPVFVN